MGSQVRGASVQALPAVPSLTALEPHTFAEANARGLSPWPSHTPTLGPLSGFSSRVGRDGWAGRVGHVPQHTHPSSPPPRLVPDLPANSLSISHQKDLELMAPVAAMAGFSH